MDTIVDEAESQLAQRLKLEREARGWSQAALAERSGVAKASISKIERGEMSPSAGLLVRLAAAFDLTLAALLVRAEQGEAGRLTRAADQPVWRDPATGYRRRQIFGRPDHPLEMAHVELPPGQSVTIPAWTYAHTRHAVWCQSGHLTIHEGGHRHDLSPGDSLGFGPPSEVTYANGGTVPCTYIVGLVRG
ncbi:MAG: helix-turn-helix transcriptional regulator [Alphaproteobacteria bacterium]|nr:helix-turn-helix transcriptional regulator [Alphaproteobacteria bacterium]